MQKEVFAGKSPIGEIIRIGSQPVEIIGVLEKETGLLSFGLVQAYVPFNTWKMVFEKMM
jgi:putative ABC transport system permease protein